MMLLCVKPLCIQRKWEKADFVFFPFFCVRIMVHFGDFIQRAIWAMVLVHFFWLFMSPVVIVVVVIVIVVIIITIFTVTESLIRIGCSFILASLLILSWLW